MSRYIPDLSGNSVVWIDQGWQAAYIGFCPSRRAWGKELRAMGIKNEPWPDAAGHTHTLYNKRGELCIIVSLQTGVEKGRSLIEITGLLAHEATHVWQYVRENMGEKSPSVEFEAYSVQAIFQNLFRAWWETRGKAAALKPL